MPDILVIDFPSKWLAVWLSTRLTVQASWYKNSAKPGTLAVVDHGGRTGGSGDPGTSIEM